MRSGSLISSLASECGERVTRVGGRGRAQGARTARSEEHTSELQSRLHLVCRLLLEKKKSCRHLATHLALDAACVGVAASGVFIVGDGLDHAESFGQDRDGPRLTYDRGFTTYARFSM